MPSRTTRLGIAIAWDRLMPSWPLLLGLAAFARAVTDPARLLADPDTYLHIAAGHWMLGHLALPLADPFSHSMAGAAWLPHEWLAEVALAAAYALGGWSGVVLVTAASFAIAVALLLRLLLDRIDPPAALGTAEGPAGLVQPFRLMAMRGLQSTFGEWLSPDFRNAPALELWILGVLFIGFASGIRLPLTRALLLVGLVHMTLQHARHEDLLAVVGPLAAAAPLGRALPSLGASAAQSPPPLQFARLPPPPPPPPSPPAPPPPLAPPP